ncbi:MAG: GNAT family N-acetyltransferase [Pseudomonadota bacterium]
MTKIRPARPSDLPDILSMIRQLCAVHGDEATVTLSALQEMLFDAGSATALVAETAMRETIGYAAITSDRVIHTGETRLDIHHLYVVEPHRGTGAGTALIAAARKVAKDRAAAKLTIGTDPRNRSAIAAYRAMSLLEELDQAGPRFRIPL